MLQPTHQTRGSLARTGLLQTGHGQIETPSLIVRGTGGGGSGLSPAELRELGSGVLLASTYQALIRPGLATIRDLGGLHRFLAWDGPLLSDSGRHLPEAEADRAAARVIHVDDDGLTFASHLDGARHRLTPEDSLAAQEALGTDIAVALDAPGSGRRRERSERWARRALGARTGSTQALFAAWEAALDAEADLTYGRCVAQMPFDGLALYGRLEALTVLAPVLPVDWARLAVGGDGPLELLASCERGADLVECQSPLDLARAGRLYSPRGVIDITRPERRDDSRPIVEGCACYACSTGFARGYLRHLFAANELLAVTLASLHNLHVMHDLMAQVRAAIRADALPELRAEVVARYGAPLAAG